MLRFPVFTSALVLGLPLAYAGMLPAFDAEAICLDLAGTSARQELAMRGCLDFQDRMRKEIALRWDGLPAYVQDSCVKASANGDYWKLKTCIDKQGRIESAEAPSR